MFALQPVSADFCIRLYQHYLIWSIFSCADLSPSLLHEDDHREMFMLHNFYTHSSKMGQEKAPIKASPDLSSFSTWLLPAEVHKKECQQWNFPSRWAESWQIQAFFALTSSTKPQIPLRDNERQDGGYKLSCRTRLSASDAHKTGH